MSNLDRYIKAATRENTQQSYDSAVRHFEVEFEGLLPASPRTVANYLSHYASTLSMGTLRVRLWALSKWHVDQGFPDPTKDPLVRTAMRGIRAEHPAVTKQAKPLMLDDLERVIAALDNEIALAMAKPDRAMLFRALRDKSFMLLGFWRGFRGDELCRLQVEWVEAQPGQGMTCFLGRTKGDRANAGTTFTTPALTRLCPVEAYLDWVNAAQLDSGPVYARINRWGHVGRRELNVDSIAPLLRSILTRTGVPEGHLYSGHSLRRGFANWASEQGWDLKGLMEYVGWRDVKSAMRYAPSGAAHAGRRINAALGSPLEAPAAPKLPAKSNT